MKILCIGTDLDKTYRHTIKSLVKAGFSVEKVDLFSLLINGKILTDFSCRNSTLILDGRAAELKDFDAIFARSFDIAAEAPNSNLATTTRRSYYSLMLALRVQRHQKIIGRTNDLSNLSKLFHCANLIPILSKFGIEVVDSCVTNSVYQGSRFVSRRMPHCIIKGASAFKTSTQVVTANHLRRLPHIVRTPTLFQSQITGPDVRVHAIGNATIGELIISSSVDYRFSCEKKHREVSLPPCISECCSLLTQTLDSALLGIDFKIDIETGKWYFLEANSMPAYHGYDIRSGGLISDAIIQFFKN